MNKIKYDKGITLVALIITIVLLLILAVVTIGTVKESNIIKYAQTATNSFKVADEKEAIGIALSVWKLEEMNSKKTFKQVITEELGERVESVEGAEDGPLTVKFKATGNVYIVTKDGEEETDDKWKKIVEKFVKAYMTAMQLTDEEEIITVISTAEQNLKKDLEKENATFYYTFENIESIQPSGGLIVAYGERKILKVTIDESKKEDNFKIIDTGIEYNNEWIQKEFSYIDLFIAGLSNQDFSFDGNKYKIVSSSEQNKVILRNVDTSNLLQLEVYQEFLCKSIVDMDSELPQIYMLVLNGNESGEIPPELEKEQFVGKYVWYDYNNDTEKEKWWVLYNNEKEGLQIVSCQTIETMTFGDAYKNVSAILNSFNNAYNNVNSRCRSLVEETRYKESVRFFGSKTVNTDDITYNTTTYNINSKTYEDKTVSEEFNDDEERAKLLGISIPEERFRKTRIETYSTNGGYTRNLFEITQNNKVAGWSEYECVLALNVYSNGNAEVDTSSSATGTTTAKILPVVKLKSEVVIDATSGDGSENAPYSLKIN